MMMDSLMWWSLSGLGTGVYLMGNNGSTICIECPSDYMYHGCSFADLDGDDKPDFCGSIIMSMCSMLKTAVLPGNIAPYVGAPTSMVI
jgi:hypothetical protein